MVIFISSTHDMPCSKMALILKCWQMAKSSFFIEGVRNLMKNCNPNSLYMFLTGLCSCNIMETQCV